MEEYILNKLYLQLATVSDLPLEFSENLERLGITVGSSPLAEGPYLMWNSESDLSLVMGSGLKLNLDFTVLKYHRKFKPSTDLLCRACGWHLGLRRVWDLTAGLGVDAMMLAQAGFDVSAIERHPYLVTLLSEALRRWREEEKAKTGAGSLLKLQFLAGDSLDLLGSDLFLKNPPEVVYYDPMYPAKRKSALPSKELQVLRELHGSSGENPKVIEKALSQGIQRIVVKRPHQAPPILGKPTSVIEGKLVRYDLYIQSNR